MDGGEREMNHHNPDGESHQSGSIRYLGTHSRIALEHFYFCCCAMDQFTAAPYPYTNCAPRSAPIVRSTARTANPSSINLRSCAVKFFRVKNENMHSASARLVATSINASCIPTVRIASPGGTEFCAASPVSTVTIAASVPRYSIRVDARCISSLDRHSASTWNI